MRYPYRNRNLFRYSDWNSDGYFNRRRNTMRNGYVNRYLDLNLIRARYFDGHLYFNRHLDWNFNWNRHLDFDGHTYIIRGRYFDDYFDWSFNGHRYLNRY